MSRTLKRCVSHLEDVESQIRRTDTFRTWKGETLSPKNARFVDDLLVMMSCIWFSASSSPDSIDRRWTNSLRHIDMSVVVDAFKSIDQELISGRHDLASFNHWRRSTYPSVGQILGPLRDDIDTFLTKGVGLRKLRTCLLFITRANFPDPLGLEEEAFAKWSERNLGTTNVINVDREKRCLTTIFNKKIEDLGGFKPRFGPGQSSNLGEVTDLEAKYLTFSDDGPLRYFARSVSFPTSDLPYRRTGLPRYGQLRFVPKSLDKMRVITAEPSPLMFYQQGIFSWMLESIRKSRWSNHIDLRRSDLNADLAWEGSISGEYATIDLSAASDGVKDWMVRSLFDDCTIYRGLRTTRTRGVEYKGEIFCPNYFAPMGSACCFPVETAVFAAVVESIMHDSRDRRAWRVYGDDIVLPDERFNQVVERLEELGFEINLDKSFHGSCPFRESCGGDYYAGEDVTPVRVSRRWSGLQPNYRSVATIVGNVDLANRLVHYPYARLRVIKALKTVTPPVIFDSDGEKGVWSKDPTNFDARSRYNQDIQSWEYYTGTVVSRPEKGFDDIRYFEWLRAREVDSSPVAESTLTIGPSNPPRWRPRWSSPAAGWAERPGGA